MRPRREGGARQVTRRPTVRAGDAHVEQARTRRAWGRSRGGNAVRNDPRAEAGLAAMTAMAGRGPPGNRRPQPWTRDRAPTNNRLGAAPTPTARLWPNPTRRTGSGSRSATRGKTSPGRGGQHPAPSPHARERASWCSGGSILGGPSTRKPLSARHAAASALAPDPDRGLSRTCSIRNKEPPPCSGRTRALQREHNLGDRRGTPSTAPAVVALCRVRSLRSSKAES